MARRTCELRLVEPQAAIAAMLAGLADDSVVAGILRSRAYGPQAAAIAARATLWAIGRHELEGPHRGLVELLAIEQKRAGREILALPDLYQNAPARGASVIGAWLSQAWARLRGTVFTACRP